MISQLVLQAADILEHKCKDHFPPLEVQALRRLLPRLQQGGGGGGEGGPGGGRSSLVSERAAADAVAAEEEYGGAAAMLRTVNEAYGAELAELSFDEVGMADGAGRYNHYYRQNIAQSPFEAAARSKVKRLLQECKSLSGEGNLPCGADTACLERSRGRRAEMSRDAARVGAESCIVVLKDESRMDVQKALQ